MRTIIVFLMMLTCVTSSARQNTTTHKEASTPANDRTQVEDTGLKVFVSHGMARIPNVEQKKLLAVAQKEAEERVKRLTSKFSVHRALKGITFIPRIEKPVLTFEGTLHVPREINDEALIAAVNGTPTAEEFEKQKKDLLEAMQKASQRMGEGFQLKAIGQSNYGIEEMYQVVAALNAIGDKGLRIKPTIVNMTVRGKELFPTHIKASYGYVGKTDLIVRSDVNAEDLKEFLIPAGK